MLTAKEALYSVRDQVTINKIEETDIISEVSNYIISHINDGWLCANISSLIKNQNDRYHVTKFLTNLGYVIEEDIVYWVFG